MTSFDPCEAWKPSSGTYGASCSNAGEQGRRLQRLNKSYNQTKTGSEREHHDDKCEIQYEENQHQSEGNHEHQEWGKNDDEYQPCQPNGGARTG